MPEEMIERWRFDKIRGAATVALQIAGNLLRQQEEGNWIEKSDEYHQTMKLVAALAAGLSEGTKE